MTKQNGKHDIGLTNSSAAEIGFMLARDKNSAFIYQESTDPPLAQQLFVDQADYSRMPPEREIRLIQSDYRAGFGLQYADGSSRYHYGINIDGRFRDELRLASLPTAVTKPTVTTLAIVNGDMELNSDWTNGAGTTQQAPGQGIGGSAAWQVTTVAATAYAYQDIQSGTDYKGRVYKITIVVKYASAVALGTIRIGLDDGDGAATYSSNHTGGGGWENLTVTKQMSASATRLRILLEATRVGADNQTAYYDNAVITYRFPLL